MNLHIADRLRPAVHPTYPRLLCAHLHQRGFDNELIFQGTRLHWSQLLGEHRYLSLEQMSRLARRAVALTEQPWIGLEIGGATSVSAHGPLGYAVISAPDLREVLRVVSRFVGVRFQLVTVEFEEHAEHCLLTLRERVDLAEMREFVAGSILATYFQLVDTVTSRRLRTAQVQVPFAAPPWAAVYEQKLGCPVEFGAERLTIRLPRSVLDTPCLTADPALYRSAVRDCEHQLKQLRVGGPLSQRIGVALLDREGDYPSLKSTAGAFAMSPRTLIRKLKAEGTSYQELLDEVRQELAAWYLLETSLPVERIAEKLGYQDPSNFSRTFQRWFGVTPMRMRKGD
jgi:AraC-like DNA-binding protein